MEAGILNFHDEETFSTSFYDPLDTMGSDQYSSDYLDVSDSHWGTEQELNGDIAVLPMECPPRHMRALHNREDYHRAFDEWQEHLMSLQPVGPDDMELDVDSHGFAADLNSTVFLDALSFTPDPIATAPSESQVEPLARPPRLSPIPSLPPCHSPPPTPPLVTTAPTDSAQYGDCFPESTNVEKSFKPESLVTDEELDESFLSLDISNIDEKALEELQLDIKGLANGDPVTSILGPLDFGGENEGKVLLPKDNVGIPGCLPEKGQLNFRTPNKIENCIKEDAILPDPKHMPHVDIKDEPLPIDFDEIDTIDIKDELNLEIDSLDIDMDALSEQMPVLEAGNLESLLEQFEASETGNTSETFAETVCDAIIKEESSDNVVKENIVTAVNPQPVPLVKELPLSPVKTQYDPYVHSIENQSVPSVPPQSVRCVKTRPVPPVELESAPSVKLESIPSTKVKSTPCVKLESTPSVKLKSISSVKAQSIPSVKLKPILSVEPEPQVASSVKTKQRKDSKPSTNSCQLHKDIRDALPREVIDRIKACGRRKEVPIIPAIPKAQHSKSSGRYTNPVPKNQRKKNVQKADQIQMDHDYCGSKESTPAPTSAKFYKCDVSELTTATVVRRPNSKTTLEITAKTVHKVPEYITIMGSNIKKDRKPGKSLLKSSLDWYDEKSSRKDSGLSSGDVSDDSESAAHLSGSSSGCETSGSTTGSTTFGRVKLANTPGKPKDLLMVSVLKKAGHLSLPVTFTKKESSQPSVARSVAPSVAPSECSAAPVASNVTTDTTIVPPMLLKKLSQPEMDLEEELKPKRRKLNLEEYRNRQKELGRQLSETEKVVSPDTVVGYNDSSVSALQPVVPEPVAPETVSREPVAPETVPPVPVSPETVLPEPVAPETVRPEPVAAETVSLEPVAPETVSLEPVAPETVRPEPVAPETVSPEPLEPETKQKDDRLDADEVEKQQLSESNIQAHTQTSPKESQVAESQAKEKPHRQYRRRRSTSSSCDSTLCIKQNQKVTSSNRESVQKRRRTGPRSKSRSRSRSKSCSKRKSRLKLRSSSVSSGSSSRRRSSSSSSCSSSSCSSSGSSSSSGSNRSRGSSVSRRSRTYSRSSRRSSRSRLNSSRSRRRERSRSNSRGRSRSWRRGSKYVRRGGRQSYSRSRSRSHSRSYSKRRRSISSRSHSSDSGRSRSCSRSRSPSRSRRYRRSRSTSVRWGGRGDGGSDSRPRSRNWRSRSPVPRNPNWQMKESERNREIEERRVVYVGRIPEETTKAELRRRFEAFGPIIDISLHFRERADNYGFVTFAYKADAYSAVERGNEDPNLARYDLCFGGRRKFCRERYSDLDGLACKNSDSYQSAPVRPAEENSFDLLLRQALRKKKL